MPKRQLSQSCDESLPEMRVLEKGHIYWFYRAKLDVKKAHDIDHVQRLYLLLSPSEMKKEDVTSEGGESSHKRRQSEPGTSHKLKHRLLIVGAKTMPKPIRSHGKLTHFGTRDTRHFAFVDIVSENLEEIDELLGKGAVSHSQKHGDRSTEAARPVGEGVYELIRYGSDLTYLAYVLEVPKEPGWPQQAFHIDKEGRILVQVKNPRIRTTKSSQLPPSRVGLSESSVAHFPKDLQEMFKGKRVKERRFISPPTPEFFNYTHAEFLLIATADDLEKFGEIGIALEAEESEEEDEIDTEFEGHSEKKLLQDLKAEHSELAEHVEAVKENPKWA